MTYSQKYSIVQFLEPVDEGTIFSMDEWLLHTTLADVFAVELNEDVTNQLTVFLVVKQPVVIKAKGDIALGSVENPTHVTLIENSSELQSLHDDLIDLLDKNGAVFNSPQYNHEGFLPHCTIQNRTRINEGDSFNVSELSIIDMFEDGDWQKRKVLKKIKFSKE